MISSKVYIPDDDYVWVAGELLLNNNSRSQIIKVKVEDEVFEGTQRAGEIRQINLREIGLPSLPLQNDTIATGAEDMSTLTYLHEASILDNLRRRHAHRSPYTYTGEICVATNPYEWLSIYSREAQEMYSKQLRNELPPHLYGTSAAAYNMGLGIRKRNQSILVSGESGSGKTESVKIMISHLACMASNSKTEDTVEKLLLSNPLMESFGNAKTSRNDNSSRFGKFTQLEFDSTGSLVGSKCVTYLLEKSRVIAQEGCERNFHVLYQLLEAPNAVKLGCHLGTKTSHSFAYTQNGDLITKSIEGVSDANRFLATVESLRMLGVREKLLHWLWRTLSAVLFLGEINVNGDEHVASLDLITAGSQRDIEACCELLGVDESAFSTCLVTRSIEVGGESTLVPLSVEQAISGRDILAKEMYRRVFQWLVYIINFNASYENSLTRDRSNEIETISLLDIFGFECMDVNRFEQLCINYANERLQQKFTSDVFQGVQKEYVFEGLDVEHIVFADNSEVIKLLEGKPGILSILNEERLIPRGSDNGFLTKVKQSFRSHKLFSTHPLRKDQFTLHHYAGKVSYHVSGFMERNKDTLPENMRSLLTNSSNLLISRIFTDSAYVYEEDHEDKDRLVVYRRLLLHLDGPLPFDNDLDDGIEDWPLVRSPEPNGAKSPATDAFSPMRNGGSNNSSASPLRGLNSAISRFSSLQKRDSFMMAGTVTSKFKSQLDSLMKTIESTEVQYVRCIKPNNNKSPNEFNQRLVCNQLRSAGMIEAIRISRAPFPNRIPHKQFLERYACLVKFEKQSTATTEFKMLCEISAKNRVEKGFSLEKIKQLCIYLLQTLGYSPKNSDHPTVYQFGRTKIFLSASFLEKLELDRREIVNNRARVIQKNFRAYKKRCEFLDFRCKCIVVQSHVRSWLATKHYRKTLHQIIKVQALVRRAMVQMILQHRLRDRSSRIISSYLRMRPHRLIYLCQRWAIIKIQSFLRRSRARSKYLRIQQKWKSVALENAANNKVSRNAQLLPVDDLSRKNQPTPVESKLFQLDVGSGTTGSVKKESSAARHFGRGSPRQRSDSETETNPVLVALMDSPPKPDQSMPPKRSNLVLDDIIAENNENVNENNSPLDAKQLRPPLAKTKSQAVFVAVQDPSVSLEQQLFLQSPMYNSNTGDASRVIFFDDADHVQREWEGHASPQYGNTSCNSMEESDDAGAAPTVIKAEDFYGKSEDSAEEIFVIPDSAAVVGEASVSNKDDYYGFNKSAWSVHHASEEERDNGFFFPNVVEPRSPLAELKRNGKFTGLRALLRNTLLRYRIRNLHDACEFGDLLLVQKSLSRRPDGLYILDKETDFNTVCQAAIRGNQLEVLKFLQPRPADIVGFLERGRYYINLIHFAATLRVSLSIMQHLVDVLSFVTKKNMILTPPQSTAVLKTGWLFKRCKEYLWQKRWVIMTSTHLFYTVGPDSHENKDSFPLQGSTVTFDSAKSMGGFTFRVDMLPGTVSTLKGKNHIVFKCADDQDSYDWVRLLKLAPTPTNKYEKNSFFHYQSRVLAVSMINGVGNTPLHSLVEGATPGAFTFFNEIDEEVNVLAIISWLLDNGCPLNARNVYHKTAFQLAIENGNASVASFLRKVGADVTLLNDVGEVKDFDGSEEMRKVLVLQDIRPLRKTLLHVNTACMSGYFYLNMHFRIQCSSGNSTAAKFRPLPGFESEKELATPGGHTAMTYKLSGRGRDGYNARSLPFQEERARIRHEKQSKSPRYNQHQQHQFNHQTSNKSVLQHDIDGKSALLQSFEKLYLAVSVYDSRQRLVDPERELCFPVSVQENWIWWGYVWRMTSPMELIPPDSVVVVRLKILKDDDTAEDVCWAAHKLIQTGLSPSKITFKFFRGAFNDTALLPAAPTSSVLTGTVLEADLYLSRRCEYKNPTQSATRGGLVRTLSRKSSRHLTNEIDDVNRAKISPRGADTANTVNSPIKVIHTTQYIEGVHTPQRFYMDMPANIRAGAMLENLGGNPKRSILIPEGVKPHERVVIVAIDEHAIF